MIGTKSIVFNFSIANSKNPKSLYKVSVQANKNFGFCDVALPKELESHDMTEKKSIRNVLFDKFQNQQLNNNIVIERLKSTLYNLLNTKEL